MVVTKKGLDGSPIQCVVKRSTGKARVKLENKFDTVDDCVDVTSQVAAEAGKMTRPDSESTYSNPIDRERAGRINNITNAMTKVLEVDPLNKRKPTLAVNQSSPYVGNSTVKRIIKADKALGKKSVNAYDPFAGFNESKLKELQDWMEDEKDEEKILMNNFYARMMTQKKDWPIDGYGWLGDVHISAYAYLLRNRSLRDPTPFFTPRIAFLDQLWVQAWYQDYKQFALGAKKFRFGESYVDVLHGRYPLVGVTNKTWGVDVDHVFFCHNIGNAHWIALHVNLLKRHIEVYDSITSMTHKDKILEEVKPYAKMIPYMLREIASPEKKRSISVAQFTVYRPTTLPQNTQTGDCGVYALKYIECLALGVGFEGLSDKSMPSLRLKMAVDIFSEVPDRDHQMSSPSQQPKKGSKLKKVKIEKP